MQQPDIPNKMRFHKVEHTDGTSIANAFASYFSSLYSTKKIRYHEDVCDTVKKLNINKATGPDNIQWYIFKGMVGFFADPLRILFNKCLKTNNFPEKWKETKVCPIFKKG